MPDATALEVFTSYSHSDEPLRAELESHLALLRRKGIVRTWFDRDVTAGDSWRGRIDEHLESSDVILLLVSADFFASDYCYDVELKRALERRDAGQVKVIPIIARAVDVEGAPFGEIQWLPSGAKAVTSWPNRDEAWTDVVKGIRRAIAELESSPTWAARHRSAPVAPNDARAIEQVPGSIPRVGAPPAAPPGPTSRALPAASAAPRADPLAAVLDRFERSIQAASARRGVGARPRDELIRIGDDLAGIVEMKRILWVDDAPDNNVEEIAALTRLQIEVRTCLGTDQAIEMLARDPEPYHLVISDWSRPAEPGTLPAGLRLLAEMKKRHVPTPLVFYYGVLSMPLEVARHATAIAAGASAATFLPGELLSAVRRILT